MAKTRFNRCSQFIGAAFSDAELIGYACAFELATRARRPPPVD